MIRPGLALAWVLSMFEPWATRPSNPAAGTGALDRPDHSPWQPVLVRVCVSTNKRRHIQRLTWRQEASDPEILKPHGRNTYAGMISAITATSLNMYMIQTRMPGPHPPALLQHSSESSKSQAQHRRLLLGLDPDLHARHDGSASLENVQREAREDENRLCPRNRRALARGSLARRISRTARAPRISVDGPCLLHDNRWRCTDNDYPAVTTIPGAVFCLCSTGLLPLHHL